MTDSFLPPANNIPPSLLPSPKLIAVVCDETASEHKTFLRPQDIQSSPLHNQQPQHSVDVLFFSSTSTLRPATTSLFRRPHSLSDRAHPAQLPPSFNPDNFHPLLFPPLARKSLPSSSWLNKGPLHASSVVLFPSFELLVKF